MRQSKDQIQIAVPRLIALALFALMIGTAAIVKIILTGYPSGPFDALFFVGAAAVVSLFLFYFFMTLQRNPTSLRIALVGLPGSGKTVFLSVLFHELPLFRDGKIAFQPYGIETIEEVARNLDILASGGWPPRTGAVQVFPFRANARVVSRFIPHRYTLEIGDYAGEHTKDFASTAGAWLHRTKFFGYVIDSDVLFLAVDGQTLARGSLLELQKMQNNLIAALQVFLDQRGVGPGKKTSIPVAVLVLKGDCLVRTTTKTHTEGADTISSLEENVYFLKGMDLVEGSLHDLLSLCKNRCRNTHAFLISAVGSVKDDGSPPPQIEPMYVCAPMLWALRHLS
jgi:hypothetical protein